ncbi:Fucolectin-5 [Dissostichus eleginoides]|uniref:Fucolectin-5 n=1 Tax=Dissostichus eleginoides TaxID=100907 RepID=A0AAD9C729_DISEL|nr:Fucolectin-5 [Dissostichus eleginoides]
MGTCAVSTYQNVALRGKATQSNRYEHVFGSASNAIDGNRDNTFDSGSCSHTERKQPLVESGPAGALHRHLRHHLQQRDCCPERLGHSPHRQLFRQQWCNKPSNSTIEALHTMTFTDRVEGRYVTVRILGDGKVLTLCEVEVYGYHAPTEENLAIQGKAAQSSLYSFYSPYYAIDGSRDSKFDDGSKVMSCSVTNNELNPWWRLTLHKTHKVFSVKITNRNAVPERINGAEIRIGDSLVNNGADNPSIPSGQTTEFEVANGMDGRYVYIGIPGRKEWLTLCEVEVFGSALD